MGFLELFHKRLVSNGVSRKGFERWRYGVHIILFRGRARARCLIAGAEYFPPGRIHAGANGQKIFRPDTVWRGRGKGTGGGSGREGLNGKGDYEQRKVPQTGGETGWFIRLTKVGYSFDLGRLFV